MVLGFYISYQKLKKSENQNLNLLYLELASEKKMANQLKSVPNKIQKLDYYTQNKLRKIKIDILNINFTLSEIF